MSLSACSDRHSLILSTLTDGVLAAAGRIIARGRETEPLASSRKSDHSLITPLDLECHSILSSALSNKVPASQGQLGAEAPTHARSERQAVSPATTQLTQQLIPQLIPQVIPQCIPQFIPVLSEEDPSTHSLLTSAPEFLIIDPIDGTNACRRFLRELGGQVGFGPLAGYVREGKICVAVYYNITTRSLYRAVLDQGVWRSRGEPSPELVATEQRLRIAETPVPLSASTLLFFISRRGESPVVERLVKNATVQTCSRFGGFANDCCRLAEGYEEVQLQFSIYAWDAIATLFSHEAGYQVIFDPLGAATPYDSWRLALLNPVVVSHPAVSEQLLNAVRAS